MNVDWLSLPPVAPRSSPPRRSWRRKGAAQRRPVRRQRRQRPLDAGHLRPGGLRARQVRLEADPRRTPGARGVHPRRRSTQAKRDREEAEARLKEYADKLTRRAPEATAIVDEARRDAEAVKRELPGGGPAPRRTAAIERARREIKIAKETAVKELYVAHGAAHHRDRGQDPRARDQPAGPRAADPRLDLRRWRDGTRELSAWRAARPTKQSLARVWTRRALRRSPQDAGRGRRSARASWRGLVELLDREPASRRCSASPLVKDEAKRALIESASARQGERPAGRRAPGDAQQGAPRPRARRRAQPTARPGWRPRTRSRCG